MRRPSVGVRDDGRRRGMSGVGEGERVTWVVWIRHVAYGASRSELSCSGASAAAAAAAAAADSDGDGDWLVWMRRWEEPQQKPRTLTTNESSHRSLNRTR